MKAIFLEAGRFWQVFLQRFARIILLAVAVTCGGRAASAFGDEFPDAVRPAGFEFMRLSVAKHASLPGKLTLRVRASTPPPMVVIEQSADFKSWRPVAVVSNNTSDFMLTNSVEAAVTQLFFRARTAPVTLDEAQEIWNRLELTNYVYRMSHSCFCAPFVVSADIAVSPGQPSQFSNYSWERGFGREPTEEEIRQRLRFTTMEEVYGAIREALQTRPDAARAEYDPGFGYPISVRFDPHLGVADDEFTLTIQLKVPALP